MSGQLIVKALVSGAIIMTVSERLLKLSGVTL
jgi:hypothetical protein